MRTVYSTVVLSLLVAACGDGADWESGGAVGTDREEITGGKLVTEPIHGAPDTSVVRLSISQAGGARGCTGIKVDATTFWTAGSCIERAVVGDEVRVTNSLDGDLFSSATYVTTVSSPVNVHPSRKNYLNQPALGLKHYDVGRLKLATDTPTIPVYSTTHPDWMDSNQTVTYTAYGADSNSFNDEKKQYAFFPLISAAAYAAASGRSLSESNAIYAHRMLSGSGTPYSSAGDDGAPVFQKFGTIWKIVGIVPQEHLDTTFVRFSNVRNWMASPAVNQFETGFQGVIFNKRTGRCLNKTVLGAITEDLCDQRVHDLENWRLEAAGFGTFRIIHSTGTCLDVAFVSGQDRLVLRPCLDLALPASQTQQWIFGTPPGASDYRFLRNLGLPGCAAATSTTSSPGPVVVSTCGSALGSGLDNWVMTRD